MNYIYHSQNVVLHINVYKGQSAVKEDFSMADLKVFLVRNLEKPLHYPMFNVQIDSDGSLRCETTNLPSGTYRVKLLWTKNNGRSPMRAESGVLFGVTEYASEATDANADTANVLCDIHTATYGYDGLNAYELSVWHGKTSMDEESWLEWMNGRQTEKRLVFSQASQWEITLTLSQDTISAQGGVITYTASAQRSVVNVYNDGTSESTTESSDVEMTCSVPSVQINSVNHTITVPSYDALTTRTLVFSATCGKQVAQAQLTQTAKPTIKFYAPVDEDGDPIDVGGKAYVTYKDFTVPFATYGDVGELSVEVQYPDGWDIDDGEFVMVSIKDKEVKGTITGDVTESDVELTLVVTDGNASQSMPMVICGQHTEYDTPSVALTYSPNPIDVNGGTSTPTLTYSQTLKYVYSNGDVEVPEHNNADTKNAIITYSDTNNLVNTSTGKIVVNSNSDSDVKTITIVTANVTINGQTGAATVEIKQNGSSGENWYEL